MSRFNKPELCNDCPLLEVCEGVYPLATADMAASIIVRAVAKKHEPLFDDNDFSVAQADAIYECAERRASTCLKTTVQ